MLFRFLLCSRCFDVHGLRLSVVPLTHLNIFYLRPVPISPCLPFVVAFPSAVDIFARPHESSDGRLLVNMLFPHLDGSKHLPFSDKWKSLESDHSKNLGRIIPNVFVKCRSRNSYTKILQNLFTLKFQALSYSHYACGSDEDISQFVGLVPANGCLITQKIHIGCTDEIIRIRECDQRDQNTGQCQKCRTCRCVILRGCAFLRLLSWMYFSSIQGRNLKRLPPRQGR